MPLHKPLDRKAEYRRTLCLMIWGSGDRTPVDARAADTADAVVADAAGCFTAWSGGVAVDVAKEAWRPEGRCG
eukprot:scaffold113822_cov21-Phaeocystis_antarctica.AAC.1